MPSCLRISPNLDLRRSPLLASHAEREGWQAERRGGGGCCGKINRGSVIKHVLNLYHSKQHNKLLNQEHCNALFSRTRLFELETFTKLVFHLGIFDLKSAKVAHKWVLGMLHTPGDYEVRSCWWDTCIITAPRVLVQVSSELAVVDAAGLKL